MQAALDARVASGALPLTMSNGPIASTKLVDEVFRTLCPAHTGLTFAKGSPLSP